MRQGRLFHGVEGTALLVGRAVDGHHLVDALFEDGFQAGFAESLLAVDDDTHECLPLMTSGVGAF